MTFEVLVVVASRLDMAATRFVAANADSGVLLMTPADLSQQGWKFHLGGPMGSTAVVAGRPIKATAIAAVMTRLPAVSDHDLPHIVPSERAYVAAEMNAFLLAWLTSLTCPLLNRPTPQCLSGPLWRQEKWVLTANRLGIPSRPVARQVPSNELIGAASSEPAGTTIAVIGRKHVGAGDGVLVKRAHALAEAAAVDLLAVQFDGDGPDARFVDANLWPDLGDDNIAEAVIALMLERTRLPNARRTPDDIAVGNFAG
jgi:hypothetical protein